MAYEPTEWKSGDVVTSAKLNKMEQGIAGAGPLVIGYSSYDPVYGTGTLDCTWQEIHDAMASGRLVVLSHTTADEEVIHDMVTQCLVVGDDEYQVQTNGGTYIASTPDGYPSSESTDPVG